MAAINGMKLFLFRFNVFKQKNENLMFFGYLRYSFNYFNNCILMGLKVSLKYTNLTPLVTDKQDRQLSLFSNIYLEIQIF